MMNLMDSSWELDPKNLIVNYIPTPVTDDKLRTLFEPFGEVSSARVILDRVTHHPKGYGFVKYTTVEAAKEAIANMNGYEICNKRLRVSQANGPQNKSINQYSEHVIQLPQTPVHHNPAPSGLQTHPPPMVQSQGHYTLLNSGTLYSGAPALVLASSPSVATSSPGYSYVQTPTTQSASQQSPQGNRVFIDMDGTAMQIMPAESLTHMFQNYINTNKSHTINSSAASYSAMGSSTATTVESSTPRQPTVVQPLYFTPFHPGCQGDPIMRSSFQMSVGASSSVMNSTATYDMGSYNIPSCTLQTASTISPSGQNGRLT